MNNLYQPIRFKRSKSAQWEKGFLRTNENGIDYLEQDRKTVVEKVYKYEVDWNLSF